MNTRCHAGKNGGPCNRVRPGEAYTSDQCYLCWVFEHDGAYRKAWSDGDDGPATHLAVKKRIDVPEWEVQPAPLGPGPGLELTKLLESLGINASLGCDCKEKARLMNEWGTEGCKARRAEIAGWLEENAGKRGWLDKFKAGARAVTSGIAFQLNPADLYGSLVDLAIQRAEAEASHS